MAQAGLMRRAAAVALGAAMVATTSGAWAASAPSPRTILPAVRFVPGSLLLPSPGPRPVLRDTCGASNVAWLVGQPRSRIPVPVDLSRRRVACTACPVAPDIRLDRLDILYDARTGLVAKVTCG